jgi:acetoin utilization deacetylase AcuC-like enzyme
MASVILAHPSSLEHDTGQHPEQAARITAIERELALHDWFGFERLRSPQVEREVLTAIHPVEYVSMIEGISASGGGALDLDTIASPGSFEAALDGAGGAVRLVEMVLDREADYGFSVHRPPGHHATRATAMGFCLFNNVAVAAQYALDHRGVERVMILDWDVHHGNGTNDIFHGSEQVLFMSIHQSPLYPGTGPAGDVGTGAGEGFTVNVPVPAGTGDNVFRSLVEHVAIPLLQSFAPQLLLISAGYDAHRDDPLAGCRVTEDGFAAMTRAIRGACDAAEVPLGFGLEGGYGLTGLARSVAATIGQLTPSPPPADDAVELEPAAEEARTRLTRWWPRL